MCSVLALLHDTNEKCSWEASLSKDDMASLFVVLLMDGEDKVVLKYCM